MRIIHVSFGQIKDTESPTGFLNRISYFTGILEEQTKKHEVHSLYFLGSGATFTHGKVHYKFSSGSWMSRNFLVGVGEWVSSISPDVLIVHGLHFPLRLLILKNFLKRSCRVFVQHHAEKPLRFHKSILQRLCDRFISGYFFVSKEQAHPWLDARLISDVEKIHEVMEVSSVFRRGDRLQARKNLGLRAEKNYLWVGRLDDNKDPITLIKAFQQYSNGRGNAHLHVVFQYDELLMDVERLITSPNQITLLGKISHDELQHWYNAADFIISTSHYEGSGVAVCEAMSCGCIPILTDIPSFRMMTDQGKVGLLFKAGDVASLVDSLRKSSEINVEVISDEVVKEYERNLSFRAIADRIDSVIQSEKTS